ncbi:MAG: nucleoside recognition protein [Pseudomonadota bacterium]
MDYMEILWEILRGGGETALMITAILLPLMVILELIKDANLLDPAARVLRPAMKALTLPKEGAYPILAGVLFGISYGSGVILAFARSGVLNRTDLLIIGLFLALCHGMIEDPLLFAAIGADYWILISVRIVLAVTVMLFLSRIIRKRSKKSQPDENLGKTP